MDTTAAGVGASLDRFLTAFEAAYNSHDPATIAALYTEDARWMAAAGLVLLGRETIAATLAYLTVAVPFVLTLRELERNVVDGYAVSIGTYTMTDASDAREFSLSGAYLNVLRQESDGWRIVLQQMNYAFPMLPAHWVGSPEFMEAQPETGTLIALAGAFAAAWNAGDTATLAALLTGDGWISFRSSPLISGQEAIAAARQAAGPDSLIVHDLSTLALGDGLAADVGWYEFRAEGRRTEWGLYSLFARQNPQGESVIHWLVSTGSPPGEAI